MSQNHYNNNANQLYHSHFLATKEIGGLTQQEVLYITSPFGYHKWIGMFAALRHFGVMDEIKEIGDLIKGLKKPNQGVFKSASGNVIKISEHEYASDDKEITEASTNINFYPLSKALSGLYSAKPLNSIYDLDFLKFRNQDEEFAAVIGTLSSLLSQGESKFNETHIEEIVLAVNQVHLMGYPPRRMI